MNAICNAVSARDTYHTNCVSDNSNDSDDISDVKGSSYSNDTSDSGDGSTEDDSDGCL